MNKLYTRWLKKKFIQFPSNSIIGSKVKFAGLKYIKVGEHTSICSNCIVTAWDSYQKQKFSPSIQIGNNVCIGEYSHITAINEIKIGDGVLTGRWVTITDNSHGNSSLSDLQIMPLERKLVSKGPVIIDNNVWIGDKVTILPRTHIGEGAIIGANSVVTKNIPPHSIACGNPASVIKTNS